MMAMMLTWCVLGQPNLALVAEVGEESPAVADLKQTLEWASFTTTHIPNASRNQIDRWRAQNLARPVKSLVVYLKMPSYDNDANLPRFWPQGATDDEISTTSFDLITLIEDLLAHPIENLVVVTDTCLPGDGQRLVSKIHTDKSVLVLTGDEHRSCEPSAALAVELTQVLEQSSYLCGAQMIGQFDALAQKASFGYFQTGAFQNFCVQPIEGPPPRQRSDTLQTASNWLLGIGIGAAAVGAAGAVGSRTLSINSVNNAMNPEQVDGAVGSGQALGTFGVVTLGVGVALVVVSLIISPEDEP